MNLEECEVEATNLVWEIDREIERLEAISEYTGNAELLVRCRKVLDSVSNLPAIENMTIEELEEAVAARKKLGRKILRSLCPPLPPDGFVESEAIDAYEANKDKYASDFKDVVDKTLGQEGV